MDPGYTQDPLGWTANLVYGQAFEGSPASKISAWNDATSAGVVATVALDAAVHVNPSAPAFPSLSVVFTSGSGVAGRSNRGIGNEGLSIQARPYEGYVIVLAPAAVTLYVGLHDRDAKTVLDSQSIAVAGSADWQQVFFALSPGTAAPCGSIVPGSDATVDCGRMGPNPGHICIRCSGEFVVGLAAPGSAHIGFSQLTPGAWGTAPGPALKSAIDVFQLMGISTIRQGGTVSQSFRWKDWLPVSQPWLRPSMGHQWGDSLVGSWGPFEFIEMAQSAGIKPILTLAYDLNKADDWADLIEFCFGDNTTTWGSKRIADGHPAIYDLQTMELGNEQENPDFVAQVTAIEQRRAAPGVNAPALTYMYPTNGGVSKDQAAALSALPGFDVARIAPDCHVGGGGGVGCAMDDWANMPDFLQSGINVETNAAISDANRMIMEASDLQTWFNVDAATQKRLRARAASFCVERSGHVPLDKSPPTTHLSPLTMALL